MGKELLGHPQNMSGVPVPSAKPTQRERFRERFWPSKPSFITVPGAVLDSGVKDLGVERVMIESEGITENVKSWRTDVIQSIIRDVPSGNVMFEAADPPVFNWYIREFGADVNLFVDHSQIAADLLEDWDLGDG
jgi:(2R)-phospho-3-sulfolactate synthase (ComA)